MRIRFRTAQTALLVLMLGATTAVVGGAAYVNARFTAQELGAKIMQQASSRIEEHLDKALSVAESESTVASLLFQEGVFEPDDHEVVSRYFLQSMRANPGLSYLSFGMETGQYYHVFRDRTDELSVLWLLPQTDGRRSLLEWAPRPDGTRRVIRDIPSSRRTPPYDRPYYQWARAEARPTWTETYVFLGSGEQLDIPGVTRAVPVYESDRQFVGVLTADFDMLALSRYLRSLPVGESGFAFIVELRRDGTRRVIAHPRAVAEDPADRLILTRAAPGGEGREALAAEEVQDPVVAEMIAHLPEAHAIPSAMQQVSFRAPETPFLGGFHALSGEDRPRWVLCTLVPEDEILGGVKKTAQRMLLVAAMGLLIALWLALFLSSRVSASLRTIAADTADIADFRLDPEPPVTSRIDELAQLGAAMEEMKAGLRSFRKFVPVDLVRSIVRSGDEAHLGSVRREITLYFSDIMGFTSHAERLTPEQLVELLAEYLGSMTAEILEAGGTVDKYIGDAIMAFWGAPLPHLDHAHVACRTALANQRTLAELRKRWSERGLPELRIRIGLHTGDALVGNFGCESRLDYTAVGDAVNLASRLEGINKVYGTEIILSDATHRRVEDEFVTRPLDKVAVQGKTEGVLIHELIGQRGDVDDATLERIETYARGLEDYLARRWDRAIAAFETVLASGPPNAAAGLLLTRTLEYRAAPPPSSWTGVHHATSK